MIFADFESTSFAQGAQPSTLEAALRDAERPEEWAGNV